ncbi:LysR family transcriptional regulator [Massilia sp. KIM]|uniref:LysR family transcriptional regulator n=1 Tax=Massilia sp. KIM TaxID=1955422 RepID=UPI00098E8DC5|nr:LysR family transcriptional regulator [Massilia sp. KIM]OON62539.1 LysR family transcriptional regulator [Massilia sp. KIM]
MLNASNPLSRLDLNLLLTLDALLAEHNVTRAAERLHLSQPSVSVQLARLREAFDDPLLLPGPRGMRPTARADALREPLRLALEALGRAIAPDAPFDPATATHTWHVAAFDYGETAILLPALAALRAAAPGTRLAVLNLPPAEIAKEAERGKVDLALRNAENAAQGMRSRSLLHERYVLAGRAGHPALRRRPSLERFRQLEHAIVSPEGGGFHGPADEVLAGLGLKRKVALSVPHFLFLLEVLASTDMVALLPERLLAHGHGLKAVEPPIAVPGFEMLMLWPERVHRDPAHRWLREQIAAAVRKRD